MAIAGCRLRNPLNVVIDGKYAYLRLGWERPDERYSQYTFSRTWTYGGRTATYTATGFDQWTTNASYNYTVTTPAEYTHAGITYKFFVWALFCERENFDATRYNANTTATFTIPYSSFGDFYILIPIYIRSSYTITFDATPGIVVPDVMSVTAGESITLPTPTRAAEGDTSYVFSGWYRGGEYGGEYVGMGGDSFVVPEEDVELVAHWHTMEIRLTPAWVTSATWSFEDYGEDIRAASGNDPGAIGMLRWRIVLPAEPKTYFESIHFGIWGDNGYIGVYPSSTLPWGEIEVCGPPPPQTQEGEFEVPYRWGDYIDVQRLAGMTVAFAYVFRQSRALLYCADRWTTPLAHNSAGNLIFGHKAYTPAEAAAPT